MKAWTDEECNQLINRVVGLGPIGQFNYRLIRAAVDEARREEREACAASARAAKYGASMSVGECKPTEETQNFAADWGDAITERIVAAILARDKEPRVPMLLESAK